MIQRNRLFFSLAGTLLLVFLLLGGAYVAISSYIAEDYVGEINQRLYGDIAQQTVREVQPLVDGRVDTASIQDIMHSMMVINPGVEVYLLEPDGDIVTYVAPYKTVELDRVDLAPVKDFITHTAAGRQRPYLKGDDPRHQYRSNPFSAAELRSESGALEGYLYIILGGDQQAAVTAGLRSGYLGRLGGSLFFLSLLGAFLLSLVVLRYLTRNLRELERSVHRFETGDYAARVTTDGRGAFASIAATFNNMAARIEANVDQLHSVNRLRRELIANISHDLRTPLAIIKGFIETLLMKNDTLPAADRERHLTTAFNSADRLDALIRQLFEYSKLEAQQIEPHPEAFDLGELAQDVAQGYAVLARRKNIDIQFETPGPLPRIYADLGLVERVLQNLLDNALKFTPPGGQVRLRMKADRDRVRVTIADTGPGIPAEDLPYVFDRYRRGHRTATGDNSGAGLGLAIVKKILELHNQTIEIKSRVRQGTSFVFGLPVMG